MQKIWSLTWQGDRTKANLAISGVMLQQLSHIGVNLVFVFLCCGAFMFVSHSVFVFVRVHLVLVKEDHVGAHCIDQLNPLCESYCEVVRDVETFD